MTAVAPLDCHVYENIAECRRSLDGLKKFIDPFNQCSFVYHSGQISSDGYWHSQDGDAYRSFAGKAATASTDAEHALQAFTEALESYCDDKDTAKARKEQALQIARDNGLKVVGELIYPPQEPEQPTGDSKAGFQLSDDAYNKAYGVFHEKAKAFNDAAESHHEADTYDKQADDALRDGSLPLLNLDTFNTIGTSLGYVLAVAGSDTDGGNIKKYVNSALAQQGTAESVMAGMKNGTLPADARNIGQYTKELQAGTLRDKNGKVFNLIQSVTPQGLKNVANYNFSDALSGIGNKLHVNPEKLEWLGKSPVLKNLGVATTALSALGTAETVSRSGHAGKEWTKFGVKTGAGIVITSASMMVPGPGWALAASIGGTYLVGKGVDYAADKISPDYQTVDDDPKNYVRDQTTSSWNLGAPVNQRHIPDVSQHDLQHSDEYIYNQCRGDKP